jgi:hypothetical protein
MKRLILILLLSSLLLGLTSAVVYASPTQGPEGQDGGIDLDETIGTLGLYAALMAVLALGTEIVIDIVRPVFGLQGKATTAESLKKLNDWLPGATKELGLSAEAQTRINETIKQLENVTGQFRAKADEAKGIVEGEWANLLKELAVDSVDNVLKYRWDGIEKKLTDQGVDLADRAKVKSWLEQGLAKVRSAQDADLPNQLALLNGVMEEVAEQRNACQGPARKLWRQTRDRLVWVGKRIAGPEYTIAGRKFRALDINLRIGGKKIESFPLRPMRHLFFLPAFLEAGWARLWRRLTPKEDEEWKWEEVIEKLGKAPDMAVSNLQQAARRLLEEDAINRQEEANRVKWLRIVSAAAGIALAYALKIDSLQLLEPLLQDAVATFKVTREGADWKTIEALTGSANLALPVLDSALDWLLNLTPGMVLSGLGAAAGSGFWHDQLDNLRAAKGVTQTVEEVKKSVSGEGAG